jgi:hypothetical protein
MQNDTSNYVVNIIPLQNVQTNVSGLDTTTSLTTDVTAIKRMVDTQAKRVYTNSIASFTTGGTVSFVSPTNLSNGLPVSGSTAATSGASTIGAGGVSLNIYDSNGAYALDLISASNSLFKVGQDGVCYAQQFVTLSDVREKANLREWTSSVMDTLSNIRPYSFNYIGGVESIGFVAQEIEAVYPQLIKGSGSTKYVNYDGMLALLVKAVQELGARVSSLEGRASL